MFYDLPTTAYKHVMHLLESLEQFLLSTFKCTQYGFAPGIALPDLMQDQPLEDFVEEEFGDVPAY